MTSKEHQSLTPMELLFRSFHLLYGNRVNTMWGEVDPDEVHTMWGRALNGYTPTEWDQALNACLEFHPAFPPTLPEFMQLCRAARLRRVSESVKLTGPKTEMPERIRTMLREYIKSHRMPS